MNDDERPPPSHRHGHFEQQRFLRPGSPPRTQTPSSQALSPHSPRSEVGTEEEFQVLNELAVPGPASPSEKSWYKHHSLEEEGPKKHRTEHSRTHGSRNSSKTYRGNPADEYNGPNTSSNLTELDPTLHDRFRSYDAHRASYVEDVQHGRHHSQGRYSSKSGNNTKPPSRDEHEELTALPRTGTSGTSHTQVNLGPSLSSELKPRPIHNNVPPATGTPRFATELYTVSYLIFFAILGTLARLGTQWLVFYPGAPVALSVLWANFAGSLFMGFLAEDRGLFANEWGSPTRETDKVTHLKIKKTIPLYIGLATGFCGCYTSFSSFMRDAFLALSNDLPTPLSHPFPGPGIPPSTMTIPRHNAYSLAAVLAVLILTISLCLSALSLGGHIALLTARFTPTLPYSVTRRVLDPLAVILGWGCWIGAVLLCIFPPADIWRGEALFACVFAPLGCLLRFGLSLWLNPLAPSFPLGTFTANILGTVVLGVAWDLQQLTSIVGGGVLGCQVLQGVMDGFDGSLTTVSTWVAELKSLKRSHAYIYGGVSIGVGLGVLVGIMGGVRWSVGWEAVVCVTGRNF